MHFHKLQARSFWNRTATIGVAVAHSYYIKESILSLLLKTVDSLPRVGSASVLRAISNTYTRSAHLIPAGWVTFETDLKPVHDVS